MALPSDTVTETAVPKALAATTRDFLWRGRLAFDQPARKLGYRFNLDPVLLAGFANCQGHVLDLGAGCGIVGILLLAMGKADRVTAVEIQPELAKLAHGNAARNRLQDRYAVICGDLRDAALPAAVDAVVFNPPYYPQAQFRPCANGGRDQGRRECNGTLAHFVDRAFFALSAQPQAQVTAIVPARRNDELGRYVANAGGQLIVQRAVHPRPQAAAVHMLVRAGWRAPSTSRVSTQQRLEPLVLHADAGRGYSDEVSAWVDGP